MNLDMDTTDIKNGQVMQAANNAIVEIEWKPIGQLAAEAKKLREELTAAMCFESKGGGWVANSYQFHQYLKERKHGSFVEVIEDIRTYRNCSVKKRKTVGAQIQQEFFVDPSKDNSGSSKRSSSNSRKSGTRKSAVVTTTEDSNADSKYAGLDEVDFNVWASSNHLGLVTKVIDNAKKGQENVFDEIEQAMIKYTGEGDVWKDWLTSAHFDRLVQAHDYSNRPTDIKDFTVFRVLGRGAFGAVSYVQRKDTLSVYAMKKMSKLKIKKNDADWLVVAEKEVLMKVASHSLLHLDYALHDDTDCYLLFQVLSGGDLKYHLELIEPPEGGNEREHGFSDKRARFYAAECLLGLEHLHDQNIVYRDIKPENVILDGEGHLVISDLGLCVTLKDYLIKSVGGTPGYWAPEVVEKKGTFKVSDIWSWGVMIYEMLYGFRPVTKKELKGKQWSPFDQAVESEDLALKDDSVCVLDIVMPTKLFDKNVKNLLNRIFVQNHEKRIGFKGLDEIKKHAWFKGIDWDALAKRETKPPFTPDSGRVNAGNLLEQKEDDAELYKNVKMEEKDIAVYKDWHYENEETKRREIVDALIKLDAPKVEEVKASGCCTIL